MNVFKVAKSLLCVGVVIFSVVSVSSSEAKDLLDLSNYRSLIADKKAYRIGDTVTILIVERSRAISSAETNRGKSIAFGADSFKGLDSTELGGQVSSDILGDARTSRDGFLSGQITVTVTDKNDLGHLLVEGTQEIIINGESQSIKLKGTLRREDIEKNNTVISSRLTNAKIEFTGEGEVSDAQDKGIIGTILSWLGLV